MSRRIFFVEYSPENFLLKSQAQGNVQGKPCINSWILHPIYYVPSLRCFWCFFSVIFSLKKIKANKNIIVGEFSFFFQERGNGVRKCHENTALSEEFTLMITNLNPQDYYQRAVSGLK